MDFEIDPFNEFRLLIAYDNSVISSYDWTDGLIITVNRPPGYMLTTK